MADRTHDALDRFWNGLAAGHADPPADLDPTLARAVRELHAAADVDGPSRAFVARLQEDLMLTDAMTLPRPYDTAIVLVPNGLVRPARDAYLPVQLRSGGRLNRLARVLSAAAILIALGVAAWVFVPDDHDPSRLGGIPAVVFEGDPLPAGVTDVETLVEVVMPEGIIAAGERTDLALMLYEIPPGTSRKPGVDVTGCCPGFIINVVLAGTATVRADGPMQLIPKGGSLEPMVVTAGTDVAIGPGDSLLYLEEVTWEWTVPESGSMSLLWGIAYGGIYIPPGNNMGWQEVDVEMKGPPSFLTSTYPIRLGRATLAPNAVLRPEPGVVQLAVAAQTEDARIAELSGYALKNRGDAPVSLYVMSAGVAEQEAEQAAVQDSSPLPGGETADETLAEITLPAGSLPTGSRSSVTAALLTIPTGSVEPWTRGSDMPGPNATLVLEGSATLSAAADVSILRAGASTFETIPPTAGMPVVAGDLLLLREDLDWTLTATGDGPVRLLSTWALDTSYIGVDLDPWVDDDLDSVNDITLPSDPVTVRFQLLRLEPDGALPPGSAFIQLALAPQADQARLARSGDGTIRNAGQGPETVYVVSFLPADPRVAAVASPTSADSVTDGVTAGETLVEVVLPADVLASRDAAEVNIGLFTVPAGSTTTWTGADPACCAGQAVMYVLDGMSIFTPGAPAYILRAGVDQPEAIGPGEAVDVGPGDTVIAREELPWEWTVAEAGPMRLLANWVLVGPSMSPPDQAAWVNETYEFVSATTLPAKPLSLQVRRVTLEAGATLPLGSALVQVAMGVPGSDARLSTLSDGAVKNVGADPADIYVLTLTPAGPAATVIVTVAAASPVAATPEP